MKILFIGDLNTYGRSFQRYRNLVELGYAVTAVSTFPVPLRPGLDRDSFWNRLASKLSLPLDLTDANRQIRKLILEGSFDIVWIEKGNTIRPATLKFVRRANPLAKIISLSEDDMAAAHNHSLYYLWGLSLYDAVFTTKTHNLTELKDLGARTVYLFLDAYDEKIHRPLSLGPEERKIFACDVGFIGTFEKDRAETMLYLAEKGTRTIVWGNGWNEWTDKHSNLVIKNQPLYDDDYVKAINATNINLCFLRKMNRDEVTSRSVEIPACGGFMLAERTPRHLEFFEEDKEAAFFGSREELFEKIRYYLIHKKERAAIARRGRARCENSGYSHRAQLQKILSKISRTSS